MGSLSLAAMEWLVLREDYVESARTCLASWSSTEHCQDLAVQITANPSSSHTLANCILTASTFELITLKKIGIDFLKYTSADLFSVFRPRFEATLLCFNALDEIDLFDNINRDVIWIDISLLFIYSDIQALLMSYWVLASLSGLYCWCSLSFSLLTSERVDRLACSILCSWTI